MYEVSFTQRHHLPDHVALIFVDTSDAEQRRGRCYHVLGDFISGWTMQVRDKYDFEDSLNFSRKTFFKRVPADEAKIDQIARRIAPPHVLDDPARDCVSWVQRLKQDLIVDFGLYY